jgi:mannose-1-phosphate guanylyltransferase
MLIPTTISTPPRDAPPDSP